MISTGMLDELLTSRKNNIGDSCVIWLRSYMLKKHLVRTAIHFESVVLAALQRADVRCFFLSSSGWRAYNR